VPVFSSRQVVDYFSGVRGGPWSRSLRHAGGQGFQGAAHFRLVDLASSYQRHSPLAAFEADEGDGVVGLLAPGG